MDLGVWMSRAVWQHKREGAPRRQAWNLPQYPDGFLPAPPAGARLFVAIRGHWRGHFQLQAFQWTPTDRRCPFGLIFHPDSWTDIDPRPAPPRNPRGYTLDVPGAAPNLSPCGNETDPL